MHIRIDRETLLERLEIVGKVSTKHVTLPVLQCVLLEAKAGELILRATNLEIGIEATLKAQVKAEGIITVPAQTLTQTIQYLNKKEVDLSVENGVLLIKSSGSETSIKSIPAEEFPLIPKVVGKGQIVNRSLFALGIKTVAFTASQSSIKPELGSIYINQNKEHSLTFVATDSFRLMEKTVPQKGVILEDSLLIPQKNALELARICESEKTDPELLVSDNQCSLSFSDGLYITSRLTNGSFPDYNQIIPKEYNTTTTLLKNELLHIFKKTNIFLNKFLQVTLLVEKSSLTITANSGEVGNTTETLKAVTEGNELTLSFNQRYLQEALPHFVDDSLTLYFAGLGRPLVIKGVSDTTLRYLVMPMNK